MKFTPLEKHAHMFWHMNENIYCRYADNIAFDDEVLVQANDELTPAKVTNVSSLLMEGN